MRLIPCRCWYRYRYSCFFFVVWSRNCQQRRRIWGSSHIWNERFSSAGIWYGVKDSACHILSTSGATVGMHALCAHPWSLICDLGNIVLISQVSVLQQVSLQRFPLRLLVVAHLVRQYHRQHNPRPALGPLLRSVSRVQPAMQEHSAHQQLAASLCSGPQPLEAQQWHLHSQGP